ncbi:MAG: redoxin domain-containing protein [Niabella sp.]|nr:redoxin domain-containing protein [Niabella sp.]
MMYPTAKRSTRYKARTVPCRGRFTLLILLLAAALAGNAQGKKLPAFQMVQANGQLFKAQQLPMGKPILLAYFSPGCDHCEKLVRQMRQRQAQLARLSVVLITYWPVKDVAAFVKQFSLQQFANFYVGTEGNTFFVRNYYHLEQLPFMALFTKNGDLVKQYHSEHEWNNLLQQIKNLK